MPEIDHVYEAQKAAEDRMAACDEIIDLEGEDQDDPEVQKRIEELYNSLAGPYDGCTTCAVREILDAAMPHLIALAREELGVTVSKMDLKPGDAVILKQHRRFDRDVDHAMAKQLEQLLPEGVKGSIVGPDVELRLVPADQHEYECACIATGISSQHGICFICHKSAEAHWEPSSPPS